MLRVLHFCTFISSAGMALALVGSGWMMLVVLGVSHVFSPAQTGELVFMTVPILKMWLFPVLVPVSLVLTAVVLVPVSLSLYSLVERWTILYSRLIFYPHSQSLPSLQYGSLMKCGYYFMGANFKISMVKISPKKLMIGHTL